MKKSFIASLAFIFCGRRQYRHHVCSQFGVCLERGKPLGQSDWLKSCPGAG